MRVTNSMLVNNLMRNLNTNMRKMDKLHNQLATGRKFAHISDDPIALIYSQAARSRLARLSHYQRTVSTAQDWIRQVEAGVMELEGRVADVYEELINAATDVKGDGDKNNVAMLVAQLRDHYVDTLNATFGDKYMYAGYNTPGDSKTGKITGPFTLDKDTWELRYNGHLLSDFLQIQIGTPPVAVNTGMVRGVFGGLNIDILNGNPSDIPGRVTDAINSVMDILTREAEDSSAVLVSLDDIRNMPKDERLALKPGLDQLNGFIKEQSDFIAAIKVDTSAFPELEGLSITGLVSVIERLDSEIADLPDNFPNLSELKAKRDAAQSHLIDLRQQESSAQVILGELRQHQETALQELSKFINTDNPEYDAFGRVELKVGGISLLGFEPGSVSTIDVVPGSLTDMMDMIAMMNTLKADVLTFDVGPAVSMPVTINGVDLVFFQGSDGKTRNIFSVLHEVYQAASRNPAAGAEELGRLIRPIQDAQNHLLTKVAELGGRTRRLDLLEARYSQDEINYEQMKSDAEDADFAEVIMYQKMAEAVYQAALSAGARIIQPTLMDFLR